MWIDFHSHKQKRQGNNHYLEIISIDPNKSSLTQGFFTLGYHPWWNLEKLTSEELEVLYNIVHNNNQCLAVGECGLDKIRGGKLEVQKSNFLSQVAIANELGCPVIIHCVRQYDLLIQLHKSYAKTPWVIHGFRRNATLMLQLMDLGIYLSVDSQNLPLGVHRDCFKNIWSDRLFLETDSSPEHTIESNYEIMAAWREIPIENLKNIIIQNTLNLFKWKNTTLKAQIGYSGLNY